MKKSAERWPSIPLGIASLSLLVWGGEVAYQTGVARDEYALWYQDSLLRDGLLYALVLLLAAAALAAGAVQFLRRRGLGRGGVAALAVLSGAALAVVAYSAHYNRTLIRDHRPDGPFSPISAEEVEARLLTAEGKGDLLLYIADEGPGDAAVTAALRSYLEERDAQIFRYTPQGDERDTALLAKLGVEETPALLRGSSLEQQYRGEEILRELIAGDRLLAG